MAYQNIGTPRFYIDAPSYLNSIGLDISERQSFRNYDSYGNPINENIVIDELSNDDTYRYENISIFGLNNVENNKIKPLPIFEEDLESIRVQYTILDKTKKYDLDGNPINLRLSSIMNAEKFYFSLLNYTVTEKQNNIFISKTSYHSDLPENQPQLDPADYPYHITGWGGTEVNITNKDFILNIDDFQGSGTAPNKFSSTESGCCIATGDISGLDELYQYAFMGLQFSANFTSLGAISFGSYYDMPHSPDLDLTMNVDFDGYDSIQTIGGAAMTNVRYAGSPWWYDENGNKKEPWAIGESNGISKRNGRRVWNLKFSYMTDKNLFSSNYMSNNYIESSTGYDSADLDTDADGNNVFYDNIDTSDSFVSQVLNKVGNGQKFIFQPDNTNNNPDQFAICQLDQNSLDITQVANNIYDISLKIREVW